ncbi:MAG: RNA polymerase sigma factor, partial [Planctomycetota bacterium]
MSPEARAACRKPCNSRRIRPLWCIAAAVLGDRAHAEDVLQEAAVIALGKLDDFDPATSFAAWMGQIVRFVALNYARRRARQRTLNVDAVANEATRKPPEPAQLTSWGELESADASFDDRVLEALRGLDETARACLLLRVVLEMSYREIARALDVPEGTA